MPLLAITTAFTVEGMGRRFLRRLAMPTRHKWGLSILCSIAAGLSYSMWLWGRDIAFVDAAAHGDIAAVRRYREQGVRPDAVGVEGMTALKYAVSRDNVSLSRFLLASGADPGGALGQATASNRTQILDMLLDAGGHMTKEQGAAALCNAADSGSLDQAIFLLHHGANVNGRASWGAGDGLTPLLCAARKGSLPMVLFLAGHGADFSALSSDGQTALLLTAERGNDADAVRVCRYLIHRGADIDATAEGKTALMEVAGRKDGAALSMLDMLLANWADTTMKDKLGQTALDYAEDCENKPAVARLQRAEIRQILVPSNGVAGLILK